MDESTLKSAEPRLYRLFENSRKANRLANSYLLYGSRNAPLQETALYLAESLSCEKGLFACRECPSCVRFEKGIRPDFRLLDGSVTSIKKEMVQSLEQAFSYSALEKGHRLSYVILHVENITDEAANALLKFLEEPKAGQVAFLTTTNVSLVLPTIVSRSLLVRVDPIDPEGFRQRLRETEFPLGKKKSLLSAGECYFLSYYSSSLEEAQSLLDPEVGFQDGFENAESVLNAVTLSYPAFEDSLLLATSRMKSSLCYNWMIRILLQTFEESELPVPPDHPYPDVLLTLKKHPASVQNGIRMLKDILAHRALNNSPTLSTGRLLRAMKEV